MNATVENPSNLNLVLDVPVSLTIELGGCKLPMREVLQLTVGSVVQLDKPADAPVELSVNGKLIARGEVVVIEDRYGVKITEVIGQPVHLCPHAPPSSLIFFGFFFKDPARARGRFLSCCPSCWRREVPGRRRPTRR
jgi:flagellar motor switch protein FliN